MFASFSCPRYSVTSVTESVTENSIHTNSYRASVTMLHCYTYFEKKKNKTKNYERNTIVNKNA
jgi:hypothetical protein